MNVTFNQPLTPTEPVTNARLNQLVQDVTVEIEADEVGTAEIEDGAVTFPKMGDFSGLEDFADDSAAATGEVPVGGLYRTGNAVKVRVV